MKQTMIKILILGLYFIAIPAFADYTSNPNAAPDDNTDSQVELNLLNKYVKNLGIYLGFDLTTSDIDITDTPLASQMLQQTPSVADLEYYTLVSVLGAVPVNMLFPDFVPSTEDNNGYSAFNSAVNNTFPSYSKYTNGNRDALSINPLIDQEPSQEDPVSQAVIDIIGTPDFSFCLKGDDSGNNYSWQDNCLFQSRVMVNALGGDPSNPNDSSVRLPGSGQIYDLSQTKSYSQLNGNTLIAPLLYSRTVVLGDTKTTGIKATTQMEAAANYIRYASGAVAPIAQINKDDYTKLYAAAYPDSPGTSKAEIATAAANEAILATYLTNMRVYAAQSSAAISNLYYILSKRIPQGTEKSSKSSQALLEFQMSTWRLYNPNSGKDKNIAWLAQINTASDAQVQKEIAVLLSEINYQMYLNRQQEERILLTNSMQLLTLLMQNKPLPPNSDSVPPAE